MKTSEFLLSIICPFHNSLNKCNRLLNNLRELDNKEVEVILIDDGSVDGTYEFINQFAADFKCSTHVVKQINKGPGGARNNGLKLSRGKYIWFVDSDDSFRKEAIDFLVTIADRNYDFVDFDLLSANGVVNTMGLTEGEYLIDKEIRGKLLAKFGRIVTKILRKDFLITNKILYPENCIYEDNPLVFLYPFVTKRFYKASIVGYLHYEEFESTTRAKKMNLRYYDRLVTALYGFSLSTKHSYDEGDRKVLEEKFIRLFLINTISPLMTKLPSLKWVMVIRVMKYYRQEAQNLKIRLSPQHLRIVSRHYCFIFDFLWKASSLMPAQKRYFQQLHLKAWGKPIKYIQG